MRQGIEAENRCGCFRGISISIFRNEWIEDHLHSLSKRQGGACNSRYLDWDVDLTTGLIITRQLVQLLSILKTTCLGMDVLIVICTVQSLGRSV